MSPERRRRDGILADIESVLFVHAHPDDETLATGALIAELVSRGIIVSLLTATRGERGEIVEGVLRADTDPETLSRIREQELRSACLALGITQHFWLGQAPARAEGLPDTLYADSGMLWIREGLAGSAADVSSDALATAPMATVTADVAALISSARPSLVVSYDAAGGYGHPDHVRVHEASVAACALTSTPYAEVVAERGSDVEWFDLEHRLPQVVTALRSHATQLSVDGDDVVHSGGQRHAIPTSTGLRMFNRA